MANNTYTCLHKKCGKTFDKLCDSDFTTCECGAYATKLIAVPAKTRVGKYGKAGGL